MKTSTEARTPDEWTWARVKDHPVTYLEEHIPGIAFWPLFVAACLVGVAIFWGWALLRLLFTPPQSFRDWWDSI